MGAVALVELQGHVIDKKYDAGYILLSYLVSLVGAWTAFELLNLRTTRKGRYNWYESTSLFGNLY